MTEDSKYECTLDKVTIKKAKDELNENPEDRLAAVKAFRDWIKAQPHIQCPETDTLMMLKFLRGAKFSQVRAREMLEGNLSLKTRAPQWFLDIDSHDPKITNLLNTGYITTSPKRTPEGCQLIIYRLGKIDTKNFSMDTLIRVVSIVVENISRDEMTQVNGVVFIMDYTNITSSHLTKMLTSDTQKWQKLLIKNIPGRFKGFHYYNAGVFFDMMMTFFRPFLPKKWMDRVHLHDTLETVYKIIPMECLPVEYLPDDYTGPHVGHIDDLVKNFISSLQQTTFRDHVLHVTSKSFSVDESKKPTEQVTQHFRKLNVD